MTRQYGRRLRVASASAAALADERLLRHYHECGDLDARSELFERFLPLARDLAHCFSHTDEPLEDLVQVAGLGLLKALDRFDPERGARFASYATPTIMGELKRYLRDSGWSVHVPRGLQERGLAAKHAVDALSAALGRSPTTREIAAELGCAREEVIEALSAAACYRASSLDASVEQDGESNADPVHLLGSEDPTYELVDELDAIARCWPELPELERRVVRLRFFEGLSQQAIGDRLGYSQMHISRLVRRALARLEASATADRRAA